MALKYLEELSDLVPKLFSKEQGLALEAKHFFSGAALYRDGEIFITLTPKGLALKLPEELREKLFAEKKAKPLRYFGKAPIKKKYALLSKESMSDMVFIKKLAKESFVHAETK